MSFHIQTVRGDITKVDDLEAIVNAVTQIGICMSCRL